MRGEEGGQPCRCSAVGTEMMGSISAGASTSSAARGRAGCLAGRKSIQAFAHSSLLFTLVGILQRIVSSQGGRKENKNTSPSRGADRGVRHPCPQVTITAARGAWPLCVSSLM